MRRRGECNTEEDEDGGEKYIEKVIRKRMEKEREAVRKS